MNPTIVRLSPSPWDSWTEWPAPFTSSKRASGIAAASSDTTGGGAHPGMMIRFLRDYEMFVPMGRAINPITKTNWEGTGVTPDVAVPADQALIVARLMILRRNVLIQQRDDVKVGMQNEIERLENELKELQRKM